MAEDAIAEYGRTRRSTPIVCAPEVAHDGRSCGTAPEHAGVQSTNERGEAGCPR